MSLSRLVSAAVPIFLVLFLSFPFQPPLQADLGEFKDSVEQEEAKRADNRDKSILDEVGTNGGCLGNCCGLLFDVFGGVTGDLWGMNNLSVVYRDYPYDSAGTHFVDFPNRHGTNASEGARSAFYRASMAGRWADDEGWGFEVSLRGHVWKFFGPELDVWSLWDGKDYLLHGGLGLNLAVFQTDPLSCDLYCQFSFFEGVLRRKGVAAGAVFTSYPFRPLVFEVKAGLQAYKRVLFFDLEASMGVMFGRFEFFGAFNMIRSELSRIMGMASGIRSYF